MADVARITKVLGAEFGDAKTELKYEGTFQLLVAVILSAQCTDKRVNLVTVELFKNYKTPTDFKNIPQQKLEAIIHSCGFYHNKAKSIIGCAEIIEDKFGGKTPGTMEELITLPGVGRKVANVILAEGFNKNAIAVDTHVFRVSKRLGLSTAKTPEQCEQDLMKIFPEKLWSRMHIQLLLFGRYKCRSQKPDCGACSFGDICTFKNGGFHASLRKL